MRAYLSRVLWVCALLAMAGPAHAIIRLNGNQMVEGAGTFGSDFKARGAMGASTATEGPARLITSLGQGVMARGELPDSTVGQVNNVAILIGVGLGYDIANIVYHVFCPIGFTGDINDNGALNTEDIIMLVNYVFKSGTSPKPCPPSGDVNCSSQVTAADVTYLVGYVFLAGPPPCDVCNLPVEARPCQGEP